MEYTFELEYNSKEQSTLLSFVTFTLLYRRLRHMARRRKTNLMLMVISLMFFICWAPLNIFNIAINFIDKQVNSN